MSELADLRDETLQLASKVAIITRDSRPGDEIEMRLVLTKVRRALDVYNERVKENRR